MKNNNFYEKNWNHSLGLRLFLCLLFFRLKYLSEPEPMIPITKSIIAPTISINVSIIASLSFFINSLSKPFV